MVDTKSSAKGSSAKGQSSAKTPTTAPAAGGGSLGQRVMGFFLPTRGAQGQRRPQSSTSRFIMGSVIFILVAELITYLLDYLNVQLKLNLNQPLAGASASWLTPFFVINVLIILGLWIALNKLGFFPRDLWGARGASSTARGAANNGANGSNGKSGAASNGSNGGNGKNNAANQIPGIGKGRTRAERRYTATVAAAAAASAKSSKNGKQRVAAASATSASGAKAGSSVADDLGTEYDDAYDRARAAQRQRKRRALR